MEMAGGDLQWMKLQIQLGIVIRNRFTEGSIGGKKRKMKIARPTRAAAAAGWAIELCFSKQMVRFTYESSRPSMRTTRNNI